MTEPIKCFRGPYGFLSNFFSCPVEYGGLTYPSAEAAYQAAKTFDTAHRIKLSKLTDSKEAKTYGQKIPIRKNWEKIKVDVMEDVVYAKFKQNARLCERLLATGDVHLEEGNRHGDVFWGTVDGKGLNKLGFCLMRVRDRIRRERGK